MFSTQCVCCILPGYENPIRMKLLRNLLVCILLTVAVAHDAMPHLHEAFNDCDQTASVISAQVPLHDATLPHLLEHRQHEQAQTSETVSVNRTFTSLRLSPHFGTTHRLPSLSASEQYIANRKQNAWISSIRTATYYGGAFPFRGPPAFSKVWA